MNELAAVIGFTFKNKIKSKAFIVTSIIIAVLIVIAVHLPLLIQTLSSNEPDRIGVVENESGIASLLHEHFQAQSNPAVEIVILPNLGSTEENLAKANEEVNAGNLKGYLLPSAEETAGFPAFNYYSKGTMDFGIGSSLEQALQVIKTEQVIKDLGLTQEQVAALTSPIAIKNVQITTDPTGGGRSEVEVMFAYILVYAFMIILFMAVAMYGNMIASEVTAEKSSRVMELLVSTVSPIKQMFGKIFATCMLGVLQLIVFILVAVASMNLPYNQELLSGFDLSVTDIPYSLFIYFIIFYLLGFFLYGTVFAALGSIVSRTEDLGQATMPITFLALAAFYMGIFGINAPNASWLTGASFFPFFTPLIMFLRIGMTEPAFWEIALSMLILAGSILLFGWIAAKIYRTGVLMYGKRPSWKEVWKAMKST